MARKNLAVIGGGAISGHYLVALCGSETYNLCALCDINPDCKSRNLYKDVPFYDDHMNMIDETDIDTAIISSPPATHFRIADELLNSGVNVLLEKPMCAEFESIEKLYRMAESAKKEVICLFHWRYADEVKFLKEYIKDKNIKKIKTHICDNYCEPDTLNIKKECLDLLGAWYDSGVNAISYIDLLIEIDNATLKSSEVINDNKSGLPVFVKKVYLCDGIEIEIVVDWRYDTREKISVITFEDGEIMVSHTNQTVVCGEKVIFNSPVGDRLESHYLNMLGDKSFKDDNEKITKRIHTVLFKES